MLCALKRSIIKDLKFHLKLGKKGQSKFQIGREKEIIRVRAEIMKYKTHNVYV